MKTDYEALYRRKSQQVIRFSKRIVGLVDRIDDLEETLHKIKRLTFAGPNTDERREMVWELADQQLSCDVEIQKRGKDGR